MTTAPSAQLEMRRIPLDDVGGGNSQLVSIELVINDPELSPAAIVSAMYTAIDKLVDTALENMHQHDGKPCETFDQILSVAAAHDHRALKVTDDAIERVSGTSISLDDAIAQAIELTKSSQDAPRRRWKWGRRK